MERTTEPHAETRAEGATRRSFTHALAELDQIKANFVDDPSAAVSDAEDLVHRAIDEVVARLHDECEAIGAGPKPKDATTDQLRARLHAYEALLERVGRWRNS